MKNLRVVFVAVLIIGGFGSLIYYLYQKEQKDPVIYETSKMFKTDIYKKTVATGSVVPRKEIEIKSQVSGIVETIYVEAGVNVKKGDLIAKVKIIPNMVSLNSAESRLKRAKISLDDSKRNYDRFKKLFKDNVVAEAEFQQYELGYKNNLEELESAENNLALVKEGAVKNSGQATNTLIKSTVTGMVLNVPIKEGNSVIESNTFNAGTTIASVADMGSMLFIGNVDESEVGKIHKGMDIILTIGAIADEEFNASLEYISPKGIEADGAIQFEIRASVELKDSVFIRAGYSGNANIVLDKRIDVWALDESTLNFRDEKIFVELEADTQIFEERFIETGLSDGINIEVLSGIDENDRIKLPGQIGTFKGKNKRH